MLAPRWEEGLGGFNRFTVAVDWIVATLTLAPYSNRRGAQRPPVAFGKDSVRL